MSDIPEARGCLETLIRCLEEGTEPRLGTKGYIQWVIDTYMVRKSPKRRARPVSVPMTAELAERIRKFAQAAPHLAQTEIAKAFQVNPGRVSEALAGVR